MFGRRAGGRVTRATANRQPARSELPAVGLRDAKHQAVGLREAKHQAVGLREAKHRAVIPCGAKHQAVILREAKRSRRIHPGRDAC